MPGTLDETYDRILASIPEETWKIGRTALMLLTYSLRPLTLDELAEGMVVNHESQTFLPAEHRLTDTRHVLEICPSLVTVSSVRRDSPTQWLAEKYAIERRDPWYQYAENKTVEVVQFAHFSVHEYMVQERARLSPGISRFGFSAPSANQTIAELSLIYLLDFSGGVRIKDIDFDAFRFLSYAARYWPEHWRKSVSLFDQTNLNGLVQRLCDTDANHSAYINYVNIYQPDFPVDNLNHSDHHPWPIIRSEFRSLDGNPHPLYFMAQLGHQHLCAWLINQQGCDVNSVRGYFGQPVHVAAHLGHRDVVSLLLDCGPTFIDIAGNSGMRCKPPPLAATLMSRSFCLATELW